MKYGNTLTYIVTGVQQTGMCIRLHHSVIMLILGSVYCCYRTLALMFSDDSTKVKCQ